MTAQVVCRDARPDDRPRLLEMIGALNDFEARLEADRIDVATQNALHLTDLERTIAREGGFILVAELPEPEGIAGFAATLVMDDSPFILPRYRRYAYIADLFVEAAWRGHGLSRALLDEIEVRVRALGLTRLGIGALAVNKDTRDAYARLGFRPYAIEHVKDLEDE